MKRRYAFFCFIWIVAGCTSSFSEKHFFKSVDAQGVPINYYRLNVAGSTFLSSSRYLSGYFDEKAVDAYFSQIVQPTSATFKDVVNTDSGNVKPLSGDLEGRKLVLLLSSNSDAIAQQIGLFANNEAVMTDLTRLIYRDRITDALSAQTAAEIQEERGKALVAIGEKVIMQMPDTADVSVVEANILFYINRLAAEFGNTAPLKTINDAKVWLEYNRARILEGK